MVRFDLVCKKGLRVRWSVGVHNLLVLAIQNVATPIGIELILARRVIADRATASFFVLAVLFATTMVRMIALVGLRAKT